MKVGIVGASGYAGGELLRLLLQHPRVEISCVTSRQYKDEYVYRVHPNLRGLINLQFMDHDTEKIGETCDFIFTAVPHGTSFNVIPELAGRGLRVVDLSADFRLKNPKDYVQWYGYEHPHPDLLSKFTYGVPELHREEIRNASLVANPGCMAVTSILALAPVVKAGLIDLERVVVDAKIGSSGAGGKPSLATHHAERYGVVRPYKPVGHRHTAEIEQELALLSGSSVKVSMSPHAVNIVRGILCTIHTFATQKVSVPDLWKVFRSSYGQEPFIRLVRDKKGLQRYPDPKVVVGSNFCDLGFELDERNGRIVLLSATDNLIRGAAGSAIQCMNIMLGFEEREGLWLAGLHPA